MLLFLLGGELKKAGSTCFPGSLLSTGVPSCSRGQTLPGLSEALNDE